MEKLKIVLADEDQKILADLTKNFTDEKFEIVATTSSGDELIESVNSKNPDFVVCDIVLKNCDGFKVLESVKNSSCKIVIHSSLSMDGFINKAISMGAKYYCIKPFDMQTLKEIIQISIH